MDEYEYATSTGGILTKEEYEDLYNIDVKETQEDKEEEDDDEERS